MFVTRCSRLTHNTPLTHNILMITHHIYPIFSVISEFSNFEILFIFQFRAYLGIEKREDRFYLESRFHFRILQYNHVNYLSWNFNGIIFSTPESGALITLDQVKLSIDPIYESEILLLKYYYTAFKTMAYSFLSGRFTGTHIFTKLTYIRF